MDKIAVFPGSFDPFTLGHQDIVNKAIQLFDKVYIGIGVNTTKKELYPAEMRKKWIELIYKNDPKIIVTFYTGLTVDFCKQINAQYIIRGIRSVIDFEYERTIAANNKILAPNIETVIWFNENEHAHINATIVREIIISGGDPSPFIPKELIPIIKEYHL